MKTKLTPEQIAQAVKSDQFAKLVRSELDLDAIETWDAGLRRDPRLLAPIDVQALAVAPHNRQQATPTETVLPIPQQGTDAAAALPVPPDPFGAPFDRPPGVYLHWAMPDGLTRGSTAAPTTGLVPAGNPLGLPPLPDRWVVVRLVTRQEQLRAWVLEADRGEHADLAGWVEPGPLPAGMLSGATGRRVFPRKSLTAVAGGDVSWAATFDAVIDRFAFYDDLADLPKAGRFQQELAYLVVGWWSDPALDPLSGCTSVGAYQERARELGWLVPEPDGLSDAAIDRSSQRARRQSLEIDSPAVPTSGYTAKGGLDKSVESQITLVPGDLLDAQAELLIPRGPAFPRLTLLHGSVMGVSLRGGPDLAPNPTAIEVAVGPNGFAALSALLADGSAEQRVSSERLLAAFSAGLLAGIDAPGGLAVIDEDRHSAAFTATSNGARSQPDRIAEGDILATNDGKPGVVKKNTTSTARSGGLKALLIHRDTNRVKEDSYRKRFPETIQAFRPPRTYRDIAVPNPRSFLPTDLTFVIRGAARSLRHGGDGRFTPAGLLACRLSMQVVRGLHGMLAGEELPAGLRSVKSGAVPPEVDLLLRELVLTNPYRWQEITSWVGETRGLRGKSVEDRVKAEMALRYIPFEETAADKLREASLLDGVDVSPVGVTRWAQPWVPLWCDWEFELKVSDRLDGCWTLGPIDLEPGEGLSSDLPPRTLRGRTLLASSVAKALAAQIRQWLADEEARDKAGQSRISDLSETELAAAATAADGQDVLTGSFRGLRESLLGLDPLETSRTLIDASGSPLSQPLARDLPLLLAGGQVTITRLRIVDGFGRWCDLPPERLKAAEIATVNAHPDGAPVLRLTPRFQRPSRLVFRFVDPRAADSAPDVEACIDQEHPDRMISPLAGWLLPDHVDEAIEFFDATGFSLGQLMHDELTGAVVWEGAPGRNGSIGGPPDPGTEPGARYLTRLAVGLVVADAAARNDPDHPPEESALSALLRTVDTTLWTIDPLGSVGTGAVAGLVGRPIAVIRATIRLEVQDDLALLAYPDEAARQARAQAYAALAERAIAVRLGELTRSDDGLLAYAVNDDYSRLSAVAPEVLEQARKTGRMKGQLSVYGRGSQDTPGVQPIIHPYLSGPHALTLHPGQLVHLTLLMAPGGKVHATSGLLPRKALALARDWFHDSLVRLSPSFRVGPVLVDPTAVRLPMITGLGDKQAFTRRDTPQTWRDDPIAAATQTAYLPEQPTTLQEGWIRVEQVEPGEKKGG